MGIKVYGPSLEVLEKAGFELEALLKQVPGVAPSSVFADRVVGKPYLHITLDRLNMSRFGMTVKDMQEQLDGAPRIVREDDKLRVLFSSGIRPQSLFAIDEANEKRLVGVVVYNRSRERLDILFMAVHEENSFGGESWDQLLLLKIVNEVRAIGARIKGISRLTVRLPSGLTTIPVSQS